MEQRISVANLQVASCLYDFIEDEALPSSGLTPADFWQGFSRLISDLTPVNRALLAKREQLQQQLDSWHQQHNGDAFDFDAYKAYLQDIGYLAPEVADFKISTTKVDAEVATLAGPQLVVPIMNARFALNAVNARWGSLYDALYGTDVIAQTQGAEKSGAYNPVRGAKVVAFAKDFLDQVLPLESGSHQEVSDYQLDGQQLILTLNDGKQSKLCQPNALIGFTGSINIPDSLLFKHHGLHFEIRFDRKSAIAQADPAGISDILLEAALTTIMDCEDSVAAVDAGDKVLAYRNWLGLIKGDLSEQVEKKNGIITRTMNSDRHYQTLSGGELTLKGRSLMFVRNVGHLMTNDAILDQAGGEIPEGILDAVVTSLIALHDVKKNNQLSNSQEGSIYIVKPKMHGPEEVAFANTLFDRVEDMLNLPRHTIKMGIMDEERRTSVNLKACIFAAKERVVFINTGFLDRTGDEIHTSMAAGPVLRKADIKDTRWIAAYEKNNVDIGLSCGLSGKAQIGKGMWPVPDQMANMLATKIGHLQAGATTAWVPSPTAATLHTLHYHQQDVFALHPGLSQEKNALLDDLLTFPVAQETNWSEEEIQAELDNNAQGILGYVVRWIDQGIGCSKVPDINNVGLMEDRATLRISSQHMANWLYHGICTPQQVRASLEKMAAVVDKQNSQDNSYYPMADDFDNNIAFRAACELVFLGAKQPSGYTEPLLHNFRKIKKQKPLQV
ncbi:malate synthase G [Thalassomonas actiniarum]|uniref:Malate synthase G n=1 Tax=Thalassomonas actiniarum TaxID=485447 RepID=A0AAE9YU70_9GAMM|nr:malate synthase G [Thalassomonas actiniarum]WDE00429.1 malate synthase G [Thalassomonas actiniarum]